MAIKSCCCFEEDEEQDNIRHRPCIVVLIVASCLSFLALQVVNILGELAGLFVNGISNVTESLPVALTPSQDVLALWTVVYVWHFLILLYCVTSLCRKTSVNKPVYSNPTLLSCFFYAYLVVCYLLMIAWLFMWDRKFLTTSAVLIFAISGSLHLALLVSCRKIYRYTVYLHNIHRSREKWFIILLVHNGVASFAAWTVVIFYLNLAVSIVYWNILPSSESATVSFICLLIFAGHYVLFVVADLLILKKYTTFILAPYVVIIASLAGMLKKNWVPGTTNSIIIASFLSFSILCALVKCIKMIYDVCTGRIHCVVDTNSTNTTNTTNTNNTKDSADGQTSGANGASLSGESETDIKIEFNRESDTNCSRIEETNVDDLDLKSKEKDTRQMTHTSPSVDQEFSVLVDPPSEEYVVLEDPLSTKSPHGATSTHKPDTYRDASVTPSTSTVPDIVYNVENFDPSPRSDVYKPEPGFVALSPRMAYKPSHKQLLYPTKSMNALSTVSEDPELESKSKKRMYLSEFVLYN